MRMEADTLSGIDVLSIRPSCQVALVQIREEVVQETLVRTPHNDARHDDRLMLMNQKNSDIVESPFRFWDDNFWNGLVFALDLQK